MKAKKEEQSREIEASLKDCENEKQMYQARLRDLKSYGGAWSAVVWQPGPPSLCTQGTTYVSANMLSVAELACVAWRLSCAQVCIRMSGC